ncbi:MAG: LysR family transcriptional regulator [Rhodobiaceae bacterium]|nr:LysR family transcriptional regulator [Rhodobiaceae bacterium]
MNLNTRALLAFLAVAETGSTHAAARSLNLSQASVSRRLARLEEDLGVSLFVRGGHQLRLSTAGAKLLPEVQKHINGLMQAVADTRGAGPDGVATITLGCLATLSLYVLPEILAKFLATEPNVRICILDLSPTEIEKSVISGSADFALTMLGVGAPELTHEVMAREPLVLVCPTDHPLAGQETVSWSQLQKIPLIGIGPHSANQRLLDSARGSIGVHLEWRHEVQRITTAVELIAAGIGLAVLPWAPEIAERSDIRIVRVVDPVIERRVGILRRSGERLSPGAARLRRHIASTLKAREMMRV